MSTSIANAYFIAYRYYDLNHGFVRIMGGHAHIEVMEGLTISDITVIIVLVLVLFASGIYLLRMLKRRCIEYMQREIQRELDLAAATASAPTAQRQNYGDCAQNIKIV